ncbi:DedA protein [Calothrix sp. NIES-4071]|nr:DedA protein [Calothrix sp. NIES-4071]BAZ62736.1 DedA protein [Calothrix sp. NIES-4105]
MFHWINKSVINIVYSFLHLGIALMMFLYNLFPPIPSELIMPLAGFTANPVASTAQASVKLPLNVQPLNIGAVFWLCLIGSTLGGLVWYYQGKTLGEKRLLKLDDKYCKWKTVSSLDITKSIEWFHCQGNKAVFIGRLVLFVRTLISVLRGKQHAFATNIFYTTLGSALWTGLLTYSGYASLYTV